MKGNLNFSRRLFWVGAVLLLAIIIVELLIVIPHVKADPSPKAFPEGAVRGFQLNIILNAIVMAVLVLFALKIKHRSILLIFGIVLLLLLIFILSFAFADAGEAFSSHDPFMHTTTITLFCCAAVEFICFILVIIAIVYLPKKIKTKQ